MVFFLPEVDNLSTVFTKLYCLGLLNPSKIYICNISNSFCGPPVKNELM